MSRTRLAAVLAALSSLAAGLPASAETLSAQQAIDRAAADNPGLKAAIHETAAAAHAIDAADGALDTTYFANVSGNNQERFNASGQGVTQTSGRGFDGSTGLRFNSDIGTTVEVGVESGIAWRSAQITPVSPDTFTVGPIYSANAYVTARQPLLRGAGSDGVLAAVRQAEAGKTQAERERDLAASQTVLDVLNAYWELWYAEQALAVQLEGLKLSEQQKRNAEIGFEELGTVPRTEVLRFASEVANVRQSVAEAETNRITRAIELGRLLGMDTARAQSLHATGTPPAPDAVPALAALQARARSDSPELKALQAQIDAARVNVASAEDADQPRLDLTGTANSSGLWMDDQLPGLNLPGDRPAFGVIVGLELELPLGGGRAEAEAAQARARLRALQARYEERAMIIDADVASAHATLVASNQRAELATEAASLSNELAEAERKRLELGTTTSVEVVRAQQDQREADLRRLRVIVDRAAAAFRQEHRAGLLLARFAPGLAKSIPVTAD